MWTVTKRIQLEYSLEQDKGNLPYLFLIQLSMQQILIIL